MTRTAITIEIISGAVIYLSLVFNLVMALRRIKRTNARCIEWKRIADCHRTNAEAQTALAEKRQEVIDAMATTQVALDGLVEALRFKISSLEGNPS